MSKFLKISIAWSIGWIVYMIAMIMTVYEGALSLIFQPIMGAVCTSLFVGLALLVGLVFKISIIQSLWRWPVALILILGSVFIMCFGSSMGITEIITHPELGHEIMQLHWVAALSGYFFLIFPIVNWPKKCELESVG